MSAAPRVTDPQLTGAFHPGPDETPAGPPIERIGKYDLYEVVGEGGFGRVFRGYDPELRRAIALKTLLPGRTMGSSAERFIREARAAGLLRHPNIVAVYEAGLSGEQYFIASEFLPGGTLKELAEGLPHGRLDPRDAAELVAQVADGLHYAHERGIVHRDIKPANILLDALGHPQVADFGLARHMDTDASISASGEVLGTPAFMSPEQARGESKQAEARTDVYGLGATMYNLVTGRFPFQGTANVLAAVADRNTDPVRPRSVNREVPKDLDTIVRKAMTKEPNGRYASAGALAEDLRRFLRGDPVKARPLGPVGLLTRWARRNPLVAGLSAALFLATAGGTAGVYVKYREAEENAEAASKQERRAVTNFVQGDKLAVRGQELVVSILRSGTLDVAEISTLTSLPPRLLDEAAGYLVEALNQPGSLRSPAEKARLHGSLSLIHRARGNLDSAEQQAREAILLLKKDESPIVSSSATSLPDGARAELDLGWVLAERRNFPAALEIFQRAQREASKSSHDSAKLLRAQATAGVVHCMSQRDDATFQEFTRIDSALAELDGALELWERLARERPTDLAVRVGRANHWLQRALLLQTRKSPPADILGAAEKARDFFKQLQNEFPQSDGFLSGYAKATNLTCQMKGVLGRDHGFELNESVGLQRTLLNRAEQRQAADPTSPVAKAELATIAEQAAIVFEGGRALDEWERAARRAVQLREELHTGQPQRAELVQLRNSLRNLLRLHMARKNFVAADELARRRWKLAAGDRRALNTVSADFRRLAEALREKPDATPAERDILTQAETLRHLVRLEGLKALVLPGDALEPDDEK